MRMPVRPVTRLTDACSRKIENHARSVPPHFKHSNFCRQPMSLDGIGPPGPLASRIGYRKSRTSFG